MNRRSFLRFLGFSAIAATASPAQLIIEASRVPTWPLGGRLGLAGVGRFPATTDDLMAITRRAFVPKLVAQLYQSAPLLTTMLETHRRVVLA